MYKLKIVTSTVRPGRKGPAVAQWVAQIARESELFEVEVLELGEINLPLMNEPHHPRQRNYQHEYSKNWSAKIDEADAFIFVTAEYDYGYPAPLRNALEYLYFEWGYKAAGLVSYGGLSGGTRAANALKADLSTFAVVPLTEMVNIAFFSQYFNDDEEFVGDEKLIKSAQTQLKALARWTKGLKSIKEDQS